jgi:hypothetical protein
MFSGLLEHVLIRTHLFEHRYRGGLTTKKTRDAFLRRKAVAALV